MKNLKDIIISEPVFINDWSDKFGVIADFEDIYMSKEEFESLESPYENNTY